MTYISKLVAGTKFPAPIGLTDDQIAAGVALGDANLMRGGSHSYDTIAERNAIPLQRRSKGMLVSVWEGGKNGRPVNYVLKGAVLPGSPADFSNGTPKFRVPMYEEGYEKYLEMNHPDYVEGGQNTTAYLTGNFYVYLQDILPEHPNAADGDKYVRVYPSGTDGWFWFYADEPVEFRTEEEWYMHLGYQDLYDADGNYAGYEGIWNNGWLSGAFFHNVTFLNAAPGAPATSEQPDLEGQLDGQTDVWTELTVEAPIFSVPTFAGMLELARSQGFQPNMYYLFPYRCKYQRPVTRESVTSDYTETFLAQATDSSTLGRLVKSIEFPEDTIYFDLVDSYNAMQGMEGMVTFRRDEIKGLEAGYDWRSVQFIRERITGFDHDTATAVAAGYEATPRFTLVANNLPQSYREHQIHFTTLNHPANPTITMKRSNGGQHTTELKKTDGGSLAQNELATLLAQGAGKAIVAFSVELNCYTVVPAYAEEALLTSAYIGIVGTTPTFRSVRLTKDPGITALQYTFGNREGSGCTNCALLGGSPPDFLPNIVLQGWSITDVRIGVGSTNITLISRHSISNVRIGAGSTNIHAMGAITGLVLGAGSADVLVAADDYKQVEVVPRTGSASKVASSAFLMGKHTTLNTRSMQIKYGDIDSVLVRNRCDNPVQITLGYGQDMYLNLSDGWYQVTLEYSYRKSWEFGAVWNYVTYIGSRATYLSDYASIRESLEGIVLIDSNQLQFPKAAVNAAAITPMVMDAQGNVFKWNGTIDEAATAGSIPKRDATGGLFATEYTMTSDARLKTDLEHIAPEAALELVRQLTGYYYRRNDIKNAPQEIGFLAQEVEDVAPALTKHIPHHVLTDAMGVNYARAVALLAPAIQALLGRIEQLEKGQ